MTSISQTWYETLTRSGRWRTSAGSPLRRLSPWLRGLPHGFLSAFEELARDERYDAGTPLVFSGAPAEEFFLVLHGSVDLEDRGVDRAWRSRGTVEAGEAFGRLGTEPFLRWPFDARAREPTRAAAVESSQLAELLHRWPTAGALFRRRLRRWEDQGSGGLTLLATPAVVERGRLRTGVSRTNGVTHRRFV